MVGDKAATMEAYPAELPEGRRVVVAIVRDLVNRHLSAGHVAAMNCRMLGREVPLSRHPAACDKQPPPFVVLAAQKNHRALGRHADSRQAHARAGGKPAWAKGCLRSRARDDLLPGAIGAVIASAPVDVHIAQYEASRARK